MKYRKIQELAAVFDTMEREYSAFARQFNGVQVAEGAFPNVPPDIARVIQGVFGPEGSAWLTRRVPAFDDQRPVDVMQTEAGRKAVKLILMRAPV